MSLNWTKREVLTLNQMFPRITATTRWNSLGRNKTISALKLLDNWLALDLVNENRSGGSELCGTHREMDHELISNMTHYYRSGWLNQMCYWVGSFHYVKSFAEHSLETRWSNSLLDKLSVTHHYTIVPVTCSLAIFIPMSGSRLTRIAWMRCLVTGCVTLNTWFIYWLIVFT